jgi:hypothetical protein
MRAAFYTCVLSLCAMAFATDARAALISHTTDFTAAGHGDSEAGFNGEYLFPFSEVQFHTLERFDPTQGTLLGVQLGLRSDFSARLNGNDFDSEAESFLPFFFTSNDASVSGRTNWGMELNLFDPGTNVVMNRTMADQCSRFEEDIVSGPDNDNTACLFETTQSGDFDWDFSLIGFTLADFIGADPLNFYTFVSGETFGFCDNDDDGDVCGVSSSILWSGDLTVTYEFLAPNPTDPTDPNDPNDPGVPVTEPGTFGVLAAGLALLALQRRRTRVRAQPAN